MRAVPCEGFSEADFSKPLSGISTSWDEMNSVHSHLRELSAWVKKSMREAGGLPEKLNVPAPGDSSAQDREMHQVLPLRAVIAASVELIAGANRFDGIDLLGTCDKLIRVWSRAKTTCGPRYAARLPASTSGFLVTYTWLVGPADCAAIMKINC